MSLISELEELRDVLLESLRSADPDKRASLAREYRTTVEKIDALAKAEPTTKKTPLDQVSAKRAERTSGSRRAEGGR